ncbi:MAG: TSUP family transporter [Bacteroidales bacterium]
MMEITTLLILIAIGLIAGIFSGIVGLGGGIIIIPALIYLVGLTQKEAQGTSLALMLPPIGLLAAINYYKAGAMNLKYAIVIAVAFLLGGYLGSRIALGLSDQTLRKIFAFALLILGMRMLIWKH